MKTSTWYILIHFVLNIMYSNDSFKCWFHVELRQVKKSTRIGEISTCWCRVGGKIVQKITFVKKIIMSMSCR